MIDKDLFAETLALFARRRARGATASSSSFSTAPAGTPRPVSRFQPVETLWTHVDEPIANRHVETPQDLDATVAARCVALNGNRDLVRSQTGFHWWPDRLAPT